MEKVKRKPVPVDEFRHELVEVSSSLHRTFIPEFFDTPKEERLLKSRYEPVNFRQALYENTLANCSLWEQEDVCRNAGLPAASIAEAKRRIDPLNQRRNDMIEAMDEYVEKIRPNHRRRRLGRLHSESIGMIVDRLCIMRIRRHHLTRILQGSGPEATLSEAASRLSVLSTLEDSLQGCLWQLVNGVADGSVRSASWRALKLYNDPRFNPHFVAQVFKAPSA